ncbi:hypothetical protein BV25DRAFT_1816306, partial [Artomyces pyxidatus]
FKVDSTRFCESCDKSVNIGFGGEANWQAHLKSERHVALAKQKPAQRNASLTQFFSRASSSLPRTASSTSVSRLSDAPSRLLIPTAASTTPSLSIDTPTPSPVIPSLPQLSLGLIPRLRVAATRLPVDVPLATSQDVLARFSGLPHLEVEDDQDPWEYADRALNAVIGYGATVSEIADLMRRGPFGIDGLCAWLEGCVRDMGINPVLLEGKITRLLDAIDLAVPPPEMNDLCDEHICTNSSLHPSPPATVIEVIDLTTSSALTTSMSMPCPGYWLQLPPGQSAILAYPFAIHHDRVLPWSVYLSDDSILLRSTTCFQTSRTAPVDDAAPLPCTNCASLHNHSLIMGIRHRALDGAHEKTPWQYLSIAHTRQLLERKNQQIDGLRLRGLNAGRQLASRAHHLDGWKRLVMAISENQIPRIHSALTVARKQGIGVFGMINMVERAARHAYSPKSFQEIDYKLTFLFWKLGGRSAAAIANHTLGTPSIDAARRHVATTPLRSCPSQPMLDDALANLKITFAGAASHRTHSVVGMTMPIDELKVQERLRWEYHSDMILGVCREHSSDIALEFRSIREADNLLAALQSGRTHMASEATVIASCLLTNNPGEYGARPFIISGTCKREEFTAHARLLEMAVHALRTSADIPKHVRLYCVASDGESRRRRTFIRMAMQASLPPSSPIYGTLAPLRLFNLLCGEDELTADFDWKHVQKRFRNTLLREKGTSIRGVALTMSVIKSHLMSNGMSRDEADALLRPNDKQDVMLMVRLLNAIASLPAAPPGTSPTFRSSRRMLRLLGTLYRHLLSAYLDVSISLHEQLRHLSAVAHIVLALYHHEKGNFIPVQLYFDVISMVKNVYFCVAKTQVDNPGGEFWTILLGTDGLEKIFGKVRTMVGNDTNADVLQLGNRISGAVQCVKILEEHPEWGGDSRRLHLKSLAEQGSKVSSKADHLNPKSFTGDLHVDSVLLLTSWQEGRRCAEAALDKADVRSPLDYMDTKGGFDILCPFGDSRIILADGILDSDEREEEPDEQDGSPLADSELDDAGGPASDTDDLEPDLDDLAAAEEPPPSHSTSEPSSKKRSAFVLLSPNDTSPQHKALVCKEYSRLFCVDVSKDRLRRVRGYSQYIQSADSEMPFSLADADEAGALLTVEDPALTLVRCNNLVFLAVVQISAIQLDSQHLQSIPASHLHEPNVRMRGHIMTLVEINATHQPANPDWEWNTRFEPGQDLVDLDGTLVELINPSVEAGTSADAKDTMMFAFHTADLRALSAILFERAHAAMHRLQTVPISKTFPYRSIEDQACFMCEDDQTARGLQTSRNTCLGCPTVVIARLRMPELLKHIGAHILHDSRFKGATNACGLCLRTGSSCVVYLKRKGKSGDQIDYSLSRCPNLQNFSLKNAAKFTKRSPCTNVPMRCPLCPKGSPAIWKYNMDSHITTIHPTANPRLYQHLSQITEDERVLMLGVFRTKPRMAKKKLQNADQSLVISEGHSSRIALRFDEDEDEDEDGDGNDDEVGNVEDDEGGNAEDDEGGDAEDDEGGNAEDDEGGNAEDDEGGDAEDDEGGGAEDDEGGGAEDDEGGGAEVSSDKGGAICKLFTGHDRKSFKTPYTLWWTAVASSCCNTHSTNDVGLDIHASGSRARVHVSGRPMRTSARRQREVTVTGEQGTLLECTECGLICTDNDAVHCRGPGCTQLFHLNCIGLLSMPDDAWFCDNDCRVNAGYRTVGSRKRRRGQ